MQIDWPADILHGAFLLLFAYADAKQTRDTPAIIQTSLKDHIQDKLKLRLEQL